ncbi:RNA polymerase sigma factor [Streptomyces sp. NPDC087511]|uniref:RNA polymerase sigma factor n=1 Tax=Streptomyces sp. NPDC087511 TaxID=3365792 RepID=UPI00382A15AC
MSIVAERPVIAQATRPKAGAKELAEEMEREDTARGPEAEPEGSVRRGRRKRAEIDATVLGAADAARLDRLYRLHGVRLVRYLAARVGWDQMALAEDLAQEVWLDLAARPYQMASWESADEDAMGMLAYRARQQIAAHLRLGRNQRETVLGAGSGADDRDVVECLEALAGAGEDSTLCAVLDLLGEADQPTFGCFGAVIAALPERQREVVELACGEGMSLKAAGSRMGITAQSAHGHLRRAAAALRLAAGAAADEDSGTLPDDYARVLNRLTGLQQQVVRLRVAGVTTTAIAARLDRNPGTVSKAYASAVRSLHLMIRERRADPVPTPVLRRGLCSEQASCVSGCYLRTARTSA